MPGFATTSNDWGYELTNEAVRVALAPGTAVVPGASNAYGSYVQAINGASAWAASQGDGCLLEIGVFDAGTTIVALDTKVNLGIDLAGGTSYTTFIADLVCGPASSTSAAQGGVWFTFPVRVPKGSSLAVQAAQNNATPKGTLSVVIRIAGDPSCPEQVRVGKYVRSFGVTAATSAGTAVTGGNAGVDGVWVALGSAIAAGDDLWWWQIGFGINNATSNNNALAVDVGVGDASFKRRVVTVFAGNTAAEMLAKGVHGRAYNATSGDIVYGRASSAGTALAGLSVAAYAVGG